MVPQQSGIIGRILPKALRGVRAVKDELSRAIAISGSHGVNFGNKAILLEVLRSSGRLTAQSTDTAGAFRANAA